MKYFRGRGRGKGRDRGVAGVGYMEQRAIVNAVKAEWERVKWSVYDT